VVDGAHNPDAARRLRESLEQYFDFKWVILIIGVSDDKDIAGVVSELVPISGEVIVTRSHHPRTMAPASIAAEFTKYGVKTQVTDNVSSALSKALSLAGERDLICVAGSLFVVAEAIEQVARHSS